MLLILLVLKDFFNKKTVKNQNTVKKLSITPNKANNQLAGVQDQPPEFFLLLMQL